MNIPYKDIIGLIKYKKEMHDNGDKEFKIATWYRKKFVINPMIRLLKASIDDEDNVIYKKDIVNFFLFLHDLKDATGEVPLGLDVSQKDNINYKLTINHDNLIEGMDYFGRIKKYYIEISTVDTASQVNSYFKVEYQIEVEDNRILTHKQYETTYITTGGNPIGDIVYRDIINTIIRYMKLYLLGE